MITIKEKVSYLRGLAEGMKITETTNEGKLLLAILDVLEDISSEFDYCESDREAFEGRLSDLEDDISELEDEVYGEYYDDNHGCDCDDCYCDEDDDCDCGCAHDHDDIQYVTIECPHCKKETSFDVDMFNKDTESVQCPYCHEEIEITYEDLDDDDKE